MSRYTDLVKAHEAIGCTVGYEMHGKDRCLYVEATIGGKRWGPDAVVVSRGNEDEIAVGYLETTLPIMRKKLGR